MGDFAPPLGPGQAPQGSPQAVTGPDGISDTSILAQHYGQVRNVIQIPFDTSLDSTNALECFFQMPAQVYQIRSAKVWVQEKPYRTYSSAASTVTGGSVTSGGPSGTTGASAINGTSDHTHTDPQGGNTGLGPQYVDAWSNLTVATSTHSHTTDIGSHTHALTDNINETAPSGTLSLFVANDGTNYGSAIVSGVTSITGQSLVSQLTSSSGDKRLKIVTTGKTRVQVLLMLDLIVSVAPGSS